MPLRHAFFLPQFCSASGELDYFLKGLAMDQQQEVDMHLVDDVRNFLFGEPIPGGFDLATLNIRAAATTACPAITISVRRLAWRTSFAGNRLRSANSSPGCNPCMAMWTVSTLPCTHYRKTICLVQVGTLITYGLAEQFPRTHETEIDCGFHDADFSPQDISNLLSTRLSDVIRRNTSESPICRRYC